MEFHEKLQTLRKQRGLTQEELAEVLFVSRTAISKWESGRGYPSLDSLKAIAKFFGVTIDSLLSCDALLSVAEETQKEKESHFRDLVFGALDCNIAMFFFLPLFGQSLNGHVQAVSLLNLTEISVWLRRSYFAVVIATMGFGILTLALQSFQHSYWNRHKNSISLLLNTMGVLLLIISSQPYAATFLFVFLLMKIIVLFKWQ